MLNEKRINGLTLDDAAAKAGGYVAYHPGKKFILDYDYRAASDYCREKGISRDNMSEEEWKLFEFVPPLVYPRTATDVWADRPSTTQ
jgi:hypothetical protein